MECTDAVLKVAVIFAVAVDAAAGPGIVVALEYLFEPEVVVVVIEVFVAMAVVAVADTGGVVLYCSTDIAADD